MRGRIPIQTNNTVIRSERPLSLAEVKIKFPFPATAKNIQYSTYQEFIAYEFLVRFEAPTDDCLATVAKAVEAFHTSGTVAELSKIQPLTQDRQHKQEVGGFPAPWFDPENIQKGVQAGERGSHQPIIWIDTARGIFYFQYTD